MEVGLYSGNTGDIEIHSQKYKQMILALNLTIFKIIFCYEIMWALKKPNNFDLLFLFYLFFASLMK